MGRLAAAAAASGGGRSLDRRRRRPRQPAPLSRPALRARVHFQGARRRRVRPGLPRAAQCYCRQVVRRRRTRRALRDRAHARGQGQLWEERAERRVCALESDARVRGARPVCAPAEQGQPFPAERPECGQAPREKVAARGRAEGKRVQRGGHLGGERALSEVSQTRGRGGRGGRGK
jgi:hypothetical protein